MKKIFILGICAIPFFFASCGGGEADGETTDTDSTAVEEVVEAEPVVTNYIVDTANTVINWNNFSEGEVDHQGTVKALNGTIEVTTTGDVVEITNAALTVDMNSISEGSEKLEGHLMAPDFFDVNNFATTEFAFDRHEEGMIYGTVTIIGKEMGIEVPATVNMDGDNVNVEIGDFQLDFTALEMPFFVTEAAEAPEEERHDPNIGFSATVVGTPAQ